MFILHDLILQFFRWTIQNPLLIYTDFINLCSTGKQTNITIFSLASVQLVLSCFSAFIHTSRVKRDYANVNDKGDRPLKLKRSLFPLLEKKQVVAFIQ